MAATSVEPSEQQEEVDRELYTLREQEISRELQRISENGAESGPSGQGTPLHPLKSEIREGTDHEMVNVSTEEALTNASNRSLTDETVNSGASSPTPPWTEGVSRDPSRLGQDNLRPTSGLSQQRRQAILPETDSAGNKITRLDIGDVEEQAARRKSFTVLARDAAEAVSEKAGDVKRKIEEFVTPSVSISFSLWLLAISHIAI